MKALSLAASIALMLPPLYLAQDDSANIAERIVGTWHGTSICVDQETDRACKDEEVIYVFEQPGYRKDSVVLKASKIVNGAPVPMYEATFTYAPATKTWNSEFKTRIHGRWSYQVTDSVMHGTLVELPSGRLARRVLVRRIISQ